MFDFFVFLGKCFIVAFFTFFLYLFSAVIILDFRPWITCKMREVRQRWTR